MNKTGSIIIGASAFACGLASQLGGDSLVIDQGSSAGAEFADAMVARPIDMKREYNGQTSSLVDELRARNALSVDGRLHILALAGVFAGRFVKYGARILLNSSVISVERISGGMLATVFTPEEGYTQITAKRVIDTRVRSFMEARKSIGVMLAGGHPKVSEGAELLCGRFDDEYILRLDVDRACTLPEAEELIDDYLSAHKSELNGAKAASVALAFGYGFDSPLDITREGVRYVPSASYADAVSAFEGGERLWL